MTFSNLLPVHHKVYQPLNQQFEPPDKKVPMRTKYYVPKLERQEKGFCIHQYKLPNYQLNKNMSVNASQDLRGANTRLGERI